MLDDRFDPDLSDPNLAGGWAQADVERLDALAELGMKLAECITEQMCDHAAACKRGESTPYTPVDLAAMSLAFTRIARGVRLTLALQAYVRANPANMTGDAVGGTRPTLIRFDPHHGDNSQPVKSPEPKGETDELEKGDREQRIERESEVFVFRSPNHALGQICRDLGLNVDWEEGNARPPAVVPRETGPKVRIEPSLHKTNPDTLRAHFTARWSRGPP